RGRGSMVANAPMLKIATTTTKTMRVRFGIKPLLLRLTWPRRRSEWRPSALSAGALAAWGGGGRGRVLPRGASLHLPTNERRNVEIRQLLPPDRRLRSTREGRRFHVGGRPYLGRPLEVPVPPCRRRRNRCHWPVRHAERRPDDVVPGRGLFRLQAGRD